MIQHSTRAYRAEYVAKITTIVIKTKLRCRIEQNTGIRKRCVHEGENQFTGTNPLAIKII